MLKKVWMIGLCLSLFISLESQGQGDSQKNRLIHSQSKEKKVGYATKFTHLGLTRETVKLYNLTYGPDKKISPAEQKSIEKGSQNEDYIFPSIKLISGRAINHFYDPIYNIGWENIEWMGIGALSAKEWAQRGDVQVLYAGGDYSFPKAIADYLSGNTARAYECLGHILHLIQDMTVPDHTRNDTHVPSNESTYEKWAEEYCQKNDLYLAEDLEGYEPPLYASLGQYFDEIAAYSNGYFFSRSTFKDTLDSPAKYPGPEVIRTDSEYLWGLDENGEEFHLAALTWLGKLNLSGIKTNRCYKLDNQCCNDYWERLSKKTVLYGAGVIRLFHQLIEAEAPTATIISPADGSSFVQGESITFKGTGVDSKDGTLTGDSLIWTSDKDGEIGSGESFGKDDLSVDEHTITLTVTDSDGQIGTDTVTINVIPQPVKNPNPWPMFRHDQQHTARSPNLGPEEPMLKWTYDPPNGFFFSGSPVTDSNGTIYVISYENVSYPNEGYLHAINPDGTEKWKFDIGPSDDTPAIGSKGIIYVSTYYDGLYAINSDGIMQWKLETDVCSSPIIGDDGTIYVRGSMAEYVEGTWIGKGVLYAVNPDGTIKWVFYATSNDEYFHGCPTIGIDGSIYQASPKCLYAINPDGSKKWSSSVANAGFYPFFSTAVGSDGTIYAAEKDTGYLCALNPEDGTLKWIVPWKGEEANYRFYGPPAIGPDGTIYGRVRESIWQYPLYAFTPEGTVKWKFGSGLGPPIVDANGILYGTCLMGEHDYLYALNPDGTEKWRLQTETLGELALDSHGIYLLGTKLCAIGGE